VDLPEIGPKDWGDVNLAVGDLPKQVVGDSELTSGADQQVGVRSVRAIQMLSEVGLLDLVQRQAPGGHISSEGNGGVEYFLAAAVVQGKLEGEAGVAGGQVLDTYDLLPQRWGQAFYVTEESDPDVALVQFVGFGVKDLLDECHESSHLILGPSPVLGGEGVEGEEGNGELAAAFHGVANALSAGAVALEPRKAMLAGPAPVAVHDDRNVAGEPRAVKLFLDLSCARLLS